MRTIPRDLKNNRSGVLHFRLEAFYAEIYGLQLHRRSGGLNRKTLVTVNNYTDLDTF